MNQGTRFLNKVAVVTSSSKGIGLATAKRLAKEGAKVMISSRNEDNVNKAVIQLVEEGLHDVHGMTCHVGEQEQVRRLFQETKQIFGGIDILFPFTGINMTYRPFLKTTDSEFDKMMDINLKAPFNMIKEAFPFLEQRPNSSIVLMGTWTTYAPQSAHFNGNGIDMYCLSKGALLTLTKALAPTLADSDIRINCVLPGPIDTEFYGWVDKEIKAVVPDFDVKKLIPVKRLGTPDEVASTMAFLASDDASFITGENFVVAGGMPSRL